MTKARFTSGSKVRITKAPKEAPYLLGKVVYPAKRKGGLCCVLIGNNFTHIKESDLEGGKGLILSLTGPKIPAGDCLYS